MEFNGECDNRNECRQNCPGKEYATSIVVYCFRITHISFSVAMIGRGELDKSNWNQSPMHWHVKMKCNRKEKKI